MKSAIFWHTADKHKEEKDPIIKKVFVNNYLVGLLLFFQSKLHPKLNIRPVQLYIKTKVHSVY